jgi:tetratricopeptide (TPR) repeat protein
VVILLPVLGLFHNGPQIAADRYNYLAGLGWAILAGAGFFACWPRLPFLLIGASLCVLPGLAALTWTQTHVWHDSQTLWTHALAIDPNSSLAANGVGEALARQGKLAEAIAHYREALRIRPGYVNALNNWGNALARQGRPAEAIERYRKALQIRPRYAEAHYNLGVMLAEEGRLGEAIEHYRQAFELRPDDAEALSDWGHALARQGKLAKAIEQYQRALRIKPDFAEAHMNWGMALAERGRPVEAIEHYRQAVAIRPDFAEAHYDWGNALAQQGKRLEALEHFQRARSIRPKTTSYPWATSRSLPFCQERGCAVHLSTEVTRGRAERHKGAVSAGVPQFPRSTTAGDSGRDVENRTVAVRI